MPDDEKVEITNNNGSDTAVNENLEAEFNDLTTVKDEGEVDEKGEENKEVQENKQEQEKPVLKDEKTKAPVQKDVAKEDANKKAVIAAETVSKADHEALVAKFNALEKSIAKPTEPAKPLLTEEDLKSNAIPVEDMLLNQFEQRDMIEMLSGDVDRAKPILKKFAKGIMECIYYDLNQKAQQQNKVQKYADEVYNSFYTDNKDLVGQEKIVKYVYDDMCKLNPNAMPHTLMPEVAIQTRELIAKLKGANAETVINKKPPVQRVEVIKGGEGADVRPVVSSTPQLTEQEKEMFELIEPHKQRLQ